MAYNLQSLITILEQILNPQQTLWIVDHNKSQLESLRQKATSLLQILDKYPLTKVEVLESQIRVAAHEAEDIIESHMVDQMLSDPEATSLTFTTPDLHQVMQQLDSATEQVAKLVEGKTCSSSGASLSRNVDSVRPKAVVGIDGDLRQLRDRLTGDNKKLEIVPIVGMGGIGKTTLARKLYEDPSIVSRFKYAWATVSQDYNIKAVLLSLLHCICGKESNEEHAKKQSDELKVILYQSLCGRRYIIVLDDIWSHKFWDEIRKYFPDNNNGSRIVITTRQLGVTKHACPKSVLHQMQVLNESESWNLLCQEAFGDQEDCPHELKGIAEKISRGCGGLPLAINVIGGLLSKVERSIGAWESIAKNVASAIAGDEHFSNILSLSYSHLPNHLKPCFLYMGAFPEDHKIEGSKLVRMWMAEGFVKANGNKSLEEEADGCLKVLVERNLIFVSIYDEYLKPSIYGMHDLLRDLCIRKSNEDKFVYLGNGRVSNPRRICVSKLFEDDVKAECIPLVRSLITFDRMDIELDSFRLVRVLDIMDISFYEFPMEILQLINLRFLAIWPRLGIPSGISRLKNLQTLRGRVKWCELFEIFEMSEMRHLELTGIIYIDEEDMKTIALNKLQTISEIRISESLIRRGFLESIPDIKDLSLSCAYNDLTPGAVDLRHLHKLETLTIYPFMGPEKARDRLSTLEFPCGLRTLVVHNHAMFPSVMTTLCALPNLEVLKMQWCEFTREGDDDGVWEVAEEDEFPSLQVLHLQYSSLVRWRAYATNFPRLHQLHLGHCYYIEEIPSSIGEIPTLQLIDLHNCSDSAGASARQIVEQQQEDYGNYTLQLRITSPYRLNATA